MSEPNILLARIDNRLIHGQVGAVWTRHIGANLVIVADDMVAEDKILQSAMKMAVNAAGIKAARFFSIQKTIEIIYNASPAQKIFIITRTPKEMRALVEGGVPIKQVNVGNMHQNLEATKKQVTTYMYCDDQDFTDLDAIVDKVDEVFIQSIPSVDRITYKKKNN